MTTIETIYNARNHLLAILKTRGFDVSEYDGYNIGHVGSMAENDQLDLLLTSAAGNKIFVKYNLDSKPNLAIMVEEFFNEGAQTILRPQDDLLVIIKDEVNDTLMELMEHIWDTQGVYVSVINIQRLQFNVLKHFDVPEFVLLGEAEREQLLAKYSLTPKQLPEIRRFDPVAVALGLRPGSVCHIKRGSKAALSANNYRVCI